MRIYETATPDDPTDPPPAGGAALTPRQRSVLGFIVGYSRDRGCPPSIRDIAREFGISSPNGVMCHVRSLRKKGHLAHEVKYARGGRSAARTLRVRGAAEASPTMPVLGLVAAGPAIEAVEQPGRVDLKTLFGDPADVALVRAVGGGMLHRHVADGDLLAVRRPNGAPDAWKTVVAVVNGRMGLWHYLPTRGRVVLSPTDGSSGRVEVGDGDPPARVVGVLAGMIRTNR